MGEPVPAGQAGLGAQGGSHASEADKGKRHAIDSRVTSILWDVADGPSHLHRHLICVQS